MRSVPSSASGTEYKIGSSTAHFYAIKELLLQGGGCIFRDGKERICPFSLPNEAFGGGVCKGAIPKNAVNTGFLRGCKGIDIRATLPLSDHNMRGLWCRYEGNEGIQAEEDLYFRWQDHNFLARYH